MAKKVQQKSNRSMVFACVALAVIAVLWLATMQLRLNSLEKSVEQMHMYSFMHGNSDIYRQRLTVNPESQQAYIPSANLKLPYSSMMDKIIYSDTSGEDLTKSGYVTLTTASQAQQYDRSNAYGAGGQPGGCYAAYVISINQEYDGENVKKMFTKTLNDGRKMTVLESTENGCIPFVTGSDGKDIVKALRKLQSY